MFYANYTPSCIAPKSTIQTHYIVHGQAPTLDANNWVDLLCRAGLLWPLPGDVKKPADTVTPQRGKEKKYTAKPFVKWAGGKGQLLETIRNRYPAGLGSTITKYAEPFAGGCAVMFDILNRYNMDAVFINDRNAELINAFRIVKSNVEALIPMLALYQSEYLPLDNVGRKQYYHAKRDRFNQLKMAGDKSVECAALFIFINRTCFNGLYRVNRKGQYNVPAGAYKNPLICDEENLRNVSKALQNVEIVCGDYHKLAGFIDAKTFVYFDPPYRPLTRTASFTSYTESAFTDLDQIGLARFVSEMSARGAKILLSNSDPKNSDDGDNFFDDLYAAYKIERVEASRAISSKKDKRGKVKELLISNF